MIYLPHQKLFQVFRMPARKRGPYNKDAGNFRNEIIAAYEANGDWLALAAEKGVPKSTAYRWIQQKDKTPKKRGGVRRGRCKVSEEHKAFIIKTIEENPRVTLNEIRAKVFSRFHLTLAKSTINVHLQNSCYTLKQVRFEPERANKPDVKERRRKFVDEILQAESSEETIVYIDETNVNLHVSRKFGRARKGERCTTVAAGSKGNNIHLIGGISIHGLVHYELRTGSFNCAAANQWMRACLDKCAQRYGRVTIVADNAPCHSQLEKVFSEPEYRRHKLIRMGPYSPMLNPIEFAWSTFKSIVKKKLATQVPQILNGEGRLDRQSMADFRCSQLKSVMEHSIASISPGKCVSFFAHVRKHYSDVMQLLDMNF